MFTLKKLDTSEGEAVYLLELSNGTRLRLSESAFKLLKLREGGVSAEEIAARLGAAQPRISPAEVEEKYQGLLEQIRAFEQREQAMGWGFWLRLPLLPAALVNRIASALAPAFERQLALVLFGLALLTFFSPELWVGKLSYGAADFWIGYALFLFSLLCHELGHASACKRFGAPPSDIGFTVYLFYPSLYSDVSAAWQLPRWQRVVVDLGGLYFQLLVGGVFAVSYVASGWLPLKLAFLMIVGVAVFSLNPIFKFDGYWVLADALGITHLQQQPWRLLRRPFDRLLGKPLQPLPFSAGIVAFLSGYTVISLTFWGFFLWSIGPLLIHRFAALPAELAAFRSAPSAASLGTLLAGAFMAFFTLFLAVRLLSGLVAPGWRRLESWLRRPATLAAGVPAGSAGKVQPTGR